MNIPCCRPVHTRRAADTAGELAAAGADTSAGNVRRWQECGRVLALEGIPAAGRNLLGAVPGIMTAGTGRITLCGGDAAAVRGAAAVLRRGGFAAAAAAMGTAFAAGERPAAFLACRGRRLQLNRTRVMGILNVTPDSFSDGGKFALHDLAVERALAMEAEGAAVIDVGGESTRPGARAVPAREEARRVVPVIRSLSTKLKKSLLSVDTCKSGVARAALDAGAHIVNDISGMRFDRRMAGVAARAGAGAVLMHISGTPRTMQQNPAYGHLLHDVYRYLADAAQRARDAGIAPRGIAVDPGIGFGKTLQHNLELLRRLSELAGLGYPVLAGASRKSFIGLTLGAAVDDRLEGSLAAVVLAASAGARLVRVHDVRETCRALALADAVAAS